MLTKRLSDDGAENGADGGSVLIKRLSDGGADDGADGGSALTKRLSEDGANNGADGGSDLTKRLSDDGADNGANVDSVCVLTKRLSTPSRSLSYLVTRSRYAFASSHMCIHTKGCFFEKGGLCLASLYPASCLPSVSKIDFWPGRVAPKIRNVLDILHLVSA